MNSKTDTYPKCTLLDDNGYNFGNRVWQVSMLIHQSCFMLIAKMHILMKSVGLGWNVTHVASFGKLKLYLIPTYIIYASLLSQVEFYLSFQARTSPALCAMQKCHQICQKRLPFVKLAWLSFISSYLSGCLVTSFLITVSEILPTANGRSAHL